MHIEFVGRHCELSAKHRAQANGYLERIVQILPNAVSARVICEEDKYRRIAEVELFIPGGNLVAKVEGTDVEQVLHDAFRKIEQQAVKHNQRDQTIRDHQKPVAESDVDGVDELRGISESLSTQ